MLRVCGGDTSDTYVPGEGIPCEEISRKDGRILLRLAKVGWKSACSLPLSHLLRNICRANYFKATCGFSPSRPLSNSFSFSNNRDIYSSKNSRVFESSNFWNLFSSSSLFRHLVNYISNHGSLNMYIFKYFISLKVQITLTVLIWRLLSNSTKNIKIFNSFIILIACKMKRLKIHFYSIKTTDTNSLSIW